MGLRKVSFALSKTEQIISVCFNSALIPARRRQKKSEISFRNQDCSKYNRYRSLSEVTVTFPKKRNQALVNNAVNSSKSTMQYIKPPTSHLSRHGTLVNFGAVQEIANKNKVVRFEGIQDIKSVADTANNNIEKTKRKPIGRQKRKDKLRRRQARKQKIRIQKQEEEAEKMEDLSLKNLLRAVAEGGVFAQVVQRFTSSRGVQDFEHLSDYDKSYFMNVERRDLIKNGNYVYFGHHLHLARESELQNLGGGTDDQSLAYSTESDRCAVNNFDEPTGFDNVLDHSFVSDETKQRLKELMGSVLNKEQKREALEVWLNELASAMFFQEVMSSLGSFNEYVRGPDFDPNAIVEHFKTRATALDSVDEDESSDLTAASSISSRSSILFAQNLEESDDTITEN